MRSFIILLPTACMGKQILVPEFLSLFGLRNALPYKETV